MWFVSRRTVVAGLLGLLALVGAVLSDAEPSSGHEWRNYLTECAPGGPYVNSTDSATHSFYYSSDATYGLSQLMRDAVSYARQTSYDPTDIYTVNSPVQGLDTDVVAFDWDITGYWCGVNWHYVGATGDVKIGNAICKGLSASAPGACEQHYLDFDTSFTNNAPNVWWRIALACHEVGHTLGLVHEGGNTCMVQNIDPNKGFISDADAIWIDDNY